MSDSAAEINTAETDLLDLLDLSELPTKVAQVQSELQRLDEAVQRAKQQVRQAELSRQTAYANQQVLQEQLQQDLERVHVLQLQQEDLLALKAAQGQSSKLPSSQALLQVILPASWLN